MRKALYFDTPEDFCDFVRLQGAEVRPGRGSLFEIHRVVHPSRPADSALVLFNFRSKLKDRFFGPGNAISAEFKDQSVRWTEAEAPAPVIETVFAKTLVECVELTEWNLERASSARLGPVFFWVENEELVASLISDSLQLGNDRIQFGPVADSDGNQATIIRIEKPSFYLIQRCLEDHLEEILIYYPEAEDLFVRWGLEHPLREWWKRSERKREGKWVFFQDGIEFTHVEPVIWQDAYNLTDLQLDFNHRHLYSESPKAPPRFEVQLRLAKKATNVSTPELWLLDEVGAQQLESTLQITDDDSLRSWQLAVQTLKGSDRDWLFIRELLTKSRQSRHHDFGGIAFSRYKGINDLLLPVGYEIQPPLRRDAYRDLFSLEAGFITLLVPETVVNQEAKEDAFLILKISERSFDSLSTFIDYLVERDAEELQDLMNGTVFDFKHYLKAPKHPGLTSGESRDDGYPKKKVSKIGDFTTPDGTIAADTEQSTESSLLDRLMIPNSEIDEAALGELELEELRLERELSSHGQSINLWCDLLVCKNQLGKTADAVICAIEALWLANGTSREAGLIDTLKTLGKNSLEDEEPSTITPQDHDWARRAAVFSVTYSEPEPHAVDQWISETTSFLREHDGGLREKERWLAWGRILSKNQDERRETRLREEIRNQITGQGIALEETPSFLRTRIFMDRKVGEDFSNQTALDAAVGNLESLREVANLFSSDRLSRASQAVMARAYSNIGALGRAQELLTDTATTDDPCALAWETMFQIEALRGMDHSRAKATEAKLEEILKKTDPDTTKAVSELRTTYEERGDMDNPAAFLARENRSRTYPGGPGTKGGELQTLTDKLEKHVTAGNEPGAVATMRLMMTLDDKGEYDHNVKLPQFVETLVAGLERFKWGDRGSSLIPLYEEFSNRVPGYITTPNNLFYGSILHSNLAHGLLVVENLERAVQQIELADKMVRDPALVDLDFIDAAAALIKTVEQLPLDHRRSILTNLMKNFRERFDQTNSPYLLRENLFKVVARALDQIAEAASSKDRLSLQQFRSYQLQDEFLILQRIQSETFIDKDDR